MKASQIESLLNKFIILTKEQDKWIDKIPMEINAAFFDNPYVTAKGQQIDLLLDFIFGTWADDVSYFLYEPAPHKITTSKKEYVVNKVSEYVDYMVSEGFAEEDRY
jgi:hypothetical protein